MRQNRTSEWNVMTVWISRQLQLFNFEHLYMWCAWIGPPIEKLWPFEFRQSFRCSILSVSICDAPKSDFQCEKLWLFEFLESFRCSISNVSIFYVPESDLRIKSYDHLNCAIASTVQFRASQYIIRLNRTSEWKVMTIWISQELPLFNFERVYMWCAWIGPPSEKLWPLEFLERFHC